MRATERKRERSEEKYFASYGEKKIACESESEKCKIDYKRFKSLQLRLYS